MIIGFEKEEADYLKKVIRSAGFNVQEFGLTEDPGGRDGTGADTICIKTEKIFGLINRTIGSKIKKMESSKFMKSLVRAKVEKAMNDYGIDLDWFSNK